MLMLATLFMIMFVWLVHKVSQNTCRIIDMRLHVFCLTVYKMEEVRNCFSFHYFSCMFGDYTDNC